MSLKVSASGYANVGGLKDGAVIADFPETARARQFSRALDFVEEQPVGAM